MENKIVISLNFNDYLNRNNFRGNSSYGKIFKIKNRKEH